MISLVTASKGKTKLRDNVRARRLGMNLTQAGLADRSGVPLPTLRKFEQTGSISLEAFLKLLMVVGRDRRGDRGNGKSDGRICLDR
ncbi:helix-turn-helix domain-containing protein [uncultured Cohaesibacter sp.]|uniref:helix-turn-helix domain-containing protein n=1 Tax=uncultured Cohaesibacter sp. TaxID=1002546 RepID=UPI003748F151